MRKEFKVLNLTISRNDSTGLDNLIATLSELNSNGFDGLDFFPKTFSLEGNRYVFGINSPIANYIMNNPEDTKLLDMSTLVAQTLYIDEEAYEALYDIDLVTLQNQILHKRFPLIYGVNSNKPYLKAVLNQEEMTYLDVALSKKLFSHPADTDLFIETDGIVSFTLYFDSVYYQKLKAEINQAYVTGKFRNTSTETEWNALKDAIDNSETVVVSDLSQAKPYASTLLEPATKPQETFRFNSQKTLVMDRMSNISGTNEANEYYFQINLSPSKIEVVAEHIFTNSKLTIRDLQNQSINDGGMVLYNDEYVINIDWTRSNVVKIKRIITEMKKTGIRTSYYN